MKCLGSRKINRCAGEFACIVKVEAFMRKLFLLVSMLGLVASALAQQVTSGTMEVAFGWVKQADGTKKSIKGLKIPFTGRQVQAARIGRSGVVAAPQFPGLQAMTAPLNRFRSRTNTGGKGWGALVADQLIYSAFNMSGTGFAIVDPQEFVDPSSLDDININSSGSGKIWSKMNFSVHSEALSSRAILIRWRIWNTHLPNPPGANDYTDEVADFGTVFTPGSGTWIYEASGTGMQQAGVVVPDTDCYVAQQLRDTSDLINGNGPFDLDFFNVYYVAAPPSPGSSQDTWTFDSDPLDGIYEDSEIDAFTTGAPPPHSNMAFQFFVNSSSTTTTSFPTTATVITGRSEQGNNISMWFSNDLDEFQLVATIFENRQIPWAEMHIETVSPGTALLSLRVQTRTMVTRPNVTQKIELWRYGGTPGWIPFDSRMMPQNGWVEIDAVYGGSVPLSQFVGAGNKLKLRLTYFAGSNSKKFVTYQDKVNWILTR